MGIFQATFTLIVLRRARCIVAMWVSHCHTLFRQFNCRPSIGKEKNNMESLPLFPIAVLHGEFRVMIHDYPSPKKDKGKKISLDHISTLDARYVKIKQNMS